MIFLARDFTTETPVRFRAGASDRFALFPYNGFTAHPGNHRKGVRVSHQRIPVEAAWRAV